MVDVVFDHVVTEQLHPFLVLSAVHMTAPLTDQQRCDFLIVDVCPCVVPVVVQQGLCGEILVEPGLVVDRGTVVMRGVDDLAVSGAGAKVDGVVLDTTEVTAPPCAVPRDWSAGACQMSAVS